MTKSAVAANILSAWEREPAINLHAFPLRIIETEDICLEGEVENIIAKRKAWRTACAVADTPRIVDRLRVRVGQQRNGQALQQAALNALTAEPAFAAMDIHTDSTRSPPKDSDWIHIAAKDCAIDLYGQVNSLSHRRLAEVIAWWVPGACNVHNQLRVFPAEEENDAEINDIVRIVLEKDPMLDAGQISIGVRNGEVTLKGLVYSQEQKHFAVYDCWYIPGVHEVHDLLHLGARPQV